MYSERDDEWIGAETPTCIKCNVPIRLVWIHNGKEARAGTKCKCGLKPITLGEHIYTRR